MVLIYLYFRFNRLDLIVYLLLSFLTILLNQNRSNRFYCTVLLCFWFLQFLWKFTRVHFSWKWTTVGRKHHKLVLCRIPRLRICVPCNEGLQRLSWREVADHHWTKKHWPWKWSVSSKCERVLSRPSVTEFAKRNSRDSGTRRRSYSDANRAPNIHKLYLQQISKKNNKLYLNTSALI